MEFLLKSSLVIGILYFFYKLFLQKETFFQSMRIYFIIGVISSILLPLLIIPVYIDAVPVIVSEFVSNESVKGVVVGIEPVKTPVKIITPFNWILLLNVIYITGVLIFITKFLIELFSLIGLIYKSKKQRNGNYIFVEVEKELSPFSIFNYIVYNKKQFNQEELKDIIAHEKVHVKQKHSIDMLLVQLLVIVQWFNPLVWLYKDDLQQNLEYIADKFAQEKAITKKKYQYLLLKTSIPNNPFALSNNFFNSHLKKRIMMLQKSQTKRINQIKYVLLLPLIVVFLYAFNVKETIKIEKEPQPTNLLTIKENNDKLKFINPIDKVNVKKISSSFGKRMNPLTSKSQFHKGIDIIANKGVAVKATANGTVKEATYNKFKGNYIQIQHQNNYQTNYHHLDKIKVIKGEKVYVGNVISTVGNTGKSTGPHLHYEVIKNKKNINPESFLTYNLFTKNNNKEVIKIVITKNTTEKQLKAIKKDLKRDGVKINFKKVKRNSKGEITSIKIIATSKNSNMSYSSSDSNGIEEVTIKFEDDNLSVYNKNKNHHTYSNSHSSSKNNRTSIHIDSHNKQAKHSKNHKIHKTIHINKNSNGNDDNHVFILDDDGGNSTYILNGKKITKEEFKKMDKSKIKSLNINRETIEKHN